MSQESDDVVVTVMHSAASISFRDGYSLDVPEHIFNRSSILRQTIETVDESGIVTLPIRKDALASWLKCLRELNVRAAHSGPSEQPSIDTPDGETLVEYLKVWRLLFSFAFKEFSLPYGALDARCNTNVKCFLLWILEPLQLQQLHRSALVSYFDFV